MTDRWMEQSNALEEIVCAVLARVAYQRSVKFDPHFLAMKFSEGERQYIAERGHLYLEDAKAVCEALLPALSDAYEAGKAEEREVCAVVADAFADENWQMTMDSIINDPILARSRHGSREPITKMELEISETETINGAVHSSMYHAAKNIAAAIRSREGK